MLAGSSGGRHPSDILGRGFRFRKGRRDNSTPFDTYETAPQDVLERANQLRQTYAEYPVFALLDLALLTRRTTATCFWLLSEEPAGLVMHRAWRTELAAWRAARRYLRRLLGACCRAAGLPVVAGGV
jgi:hypothetical protein